jgi:hypothetical protein
VCEAADLAVLTNHWTCEVARSRHSPSRQQSELTRFADAMAQGICGSCVRTIPGVGHADRLIVRAGIMQCAVPPKWKLRRHFGGVALHNSALRIIRNHVLHLQQQ